MAAATAGTGALLPSWSHADSRLGGGLALDMTYILGVMNLNFLYQ